MKDEKFERPSILNTWVSTMRGKPGNFTELEGRFDNDLLFVVHTAPVLWGVVDMGDDHYQITSWDPENFIWRNICEGDIVMEWMPIERGEYR